MKELFLLRCINHYPCKIFFVQQTVGHIVYLLKKTSKNHWHCKNRQRFEGRIGYQILIFRHYHLPPKRKVGGSNPFWRARKGQISNEICPFLVRAMGLEPIRDYHTPLKRARLPIPPRSQTMLSLFLRR